MVRSPKEWCRYGFAARVSCKMLLVDDGDDGDVDDDDDDGDEVRRIASKK